MSIDLKRMNKNYFIVQELIIGGKGSVILYVSQNKRQEKINKIQLVALLEKLFNIEDIRVNGNVVYVNDKKIIFKVACEALAGMRATQIVADFYHLTPEEQERYEDYLTYSMSTRLDTDEGKIFVQNKYVISEKVNKILGDKLLY